MSKNLPLNTAICVHCGSKITKRIGYSAAKGGSIWQCLGTDCGKQFLVPTLVLSKKAS